MGQSQSATTRADVVPLVSGAVNVLQGPPPEQNGALHRWKVAVPADSSRTSESLDVVREEGSRSSQWDDNFHSIFLSHSGAQKSFVEQLCVDMERYDRYPFFDKRRDSLPIGCHFPSLIFEAIDHDQCRVGVVVLSEEFFTQSKWPMLELVAMVKRQTRDPKFIIMPVFLHIKHAECRKKVNHDRWLTKHWQGWAKEDNRIDLKKWQEALEVFGPINGVSLNDKLDEVKCREEVVEALCKEVPPLTRWDDSHVQGRLRMCWAIRREIDGLQLSRSYGVQVLGLYGMGGIGKSTACKVLCNDYFKEFEGRVCHIEFGVGSKLVRLQEMLRRLTKTNQELIKTFCEDECKDRLKRGLKKKVLLAIDNVSDEQNIVDEARDLLRVEFAEGSIVIVTARSLPQLRYLNISPHECTEMPSLEEDGARSLFLYHAAPGSYVKNANKVNKELLMECIQQCCFGKGDGKNYYYHPLALKVLGGQFGNDPEEWVKKLKEVDVFNIYQEDDKDHPIYSILGISFEKLRLEDKLLFMDVAIYAPYYRFYKNIKTFDWLSMVHGRSVSDIKKRLEGLKNKSLLENVDEGRKIRMHDLWHGFAAMKARAGEFELRPWVLEEAFSVDDSLREDSCLLGGGWESLQRVCMVSGSIGMVREINLNRCSNLRVLKLLWVEIEAGVLDVRSLSQLKSLLIYRRGFWDRRRPMLLILGLGCLRNLVHFQGIYVEIGTNSLFEGIWSLTSLRFFEATACQFRVQDLIALEKHHANYAHFRQLHTLILDIVLEMDLLDLSTFLQLKKLIISRCGIMGLTCSAPLTALEHLDLYKCQSLKALPDLDHLLALSYFRVWDCGEVQLTLIEIEKLEAMCPGLRLFFRRGFDWMNFIKRRRDLLKGSLSVLKTMPDEDGTEEPTHLNTKAYNEFLVSSMDELTTRYTGYGDVSAIQANRPVPWQGLLYYFEITVKDHGQKGAIGIGFTDEHFSTISMPGWEKNSYGYHGDDGKLYCEQGIGKPYAQGFTTGDTIGAGIKYAMHEIFFTQNGNVLPSVTIKDVKHLLYPTIGLSSPKEKVEVNFGMRKFLFDLESMFLKDRGCR